MTTTEQPLSARTAKADEFVRHLRERLYAHGINSDLVAYLVAHVAAPGNSGGEVVLPMHPDPMPDFAAATPLDRALMAAKVAGGIAGRIHETVNQLAVWPAIAFKLNGRNPDLDVRTMGHVALRTLEIKIGFAAGGLARPRWNWQTGELLEVAHAAGGAG